MWHIGKGRKELAHLSFSFVAQFIELRDVIFQRTNFLAPHICFRLFSFLHERANLTTARIALGVQPI